MSNSSTPITPKLINVISNGMMLLWAGGILLGPQTLASAEPSLATKEDLTPVEANLPPVDPKLEELTFFTKEWQCTGEGADQNEIPRYQWEMIRELNDLWFFAQSKRQPTGIFEIETLGYNTIMGKFGRTIIANDGKFANFLSDGWQDNKMVWMGSSSNMVDKTTGKHQIVVTKMGDRSFTEVERMATEEGQWTVISTKECALAEEQNPLMETK